MPDVLDLYERLAGKGERFTVAAYIRGKRRWVKLPGVHRAAEATLLAARVRRRHRVPVAVTAAASA